MADGRRDDRTGGSISSIVAWLGLFVGKPESGRLRDCSGSNEIQQLFTKIYGILQKAKAEVKDIHLRNAEKIEKVAQRQDGFLEKRKRGFEREECGF